ncbi:MAG TPA: hypothetical protein VHI98_00115 [Vicinamibacterales bacterium]|jgi:hypothetical protein|nr:hypothetical protein [Vicinamibacterales bacterium]
MRALGHGVLTVASGVILLAGPALDATPREGAGSAEQSSVDQFLSRRDDPSSYSAFRRMNAENPGSGRSGWLEAVTDFSPESGFRYEILAEGGSEAIRSKVLRAVLEGEKQLVARGIAKSAIAETNYDFRLDGVDSDGLVKVLLSPRRKETALINGAMFLSPTDGDLVRVEGRLARSPSFWVQRVDIVRTYQRIEGALVPVAVESVAHVRFFGTSTLRMTYDYSEIDGRAVRP